MLHKDFIKRVFPVALLGIFDTFREVIGYALDETQTRIYGLKNEIFPDTADETVPDWERITGITGGDTKPLQARRDAVVAALRARGPTTAQDFIDLAADRGQTITIEEFQPFRVGVNRVGDRLYPANVVFVWQVTLQSQALFYFRIGHSRVGDRLLYTDQQDSLEVLFKKHKPAHTHVVFEYP